jgi:hypothetical protein
MNFPLSLALCLPLIANSLHAQQADPFAAPPVRQISGTYYTAPYGPNGTWNLYQAQQTPMTWTQAQETAAKLVDPLGGTGKMGHLVTISGAAENMFVFQKVIGTWIWIGLTDHEAWGGKEAGMQRNDGWRWVTGEPLTWSAWRSIEPNERDERGEDGVAQQQSGRWADVGRGADGQDMARNPSMIEWDTQSKEPVPGAIVIGPILPPKWPTDLTKFIGPTEGTGPWIMVGAINLNGASLETVIRGLTPKIANITKAYRMERLNYRYPGTGGVMAGGWVDIPDKPLHPSTEQGCGALHVARINLPKAGTWSFNIHADDFFAIRFPGRKWKSATGLGGIDPADAEVLYFDTVSGDANAIGIIDLPAGEQTMEVVLGNRFNEVMLQVLAAEGEFTMDGATDRWRSPGYKAGEALPFPGMDEKGWTITRTDRPATAKKPKDLTEAMALAETGTGTTTKDVPVVNFIDSDAPSDLKFPNPANLPGDRPGNQDDFVIQATGNLVIPQDGVYHIGIHAAEFVALRIVDQAWTRIVRDSGYFAKLDGDTIYEGDPDHMGTNAQLVAEISLKKGTYQMEAIHLSTTSPTTISIFGGPAGYAPRLLSTGGAKVEPDVAGLPLVGF